MKVILAGKPGCPYFARAYSFLYERCDYFAVWESIKNTKYKPEEYDIGIAFLHPWKIPKEHLVNTWYNFHPGPLPDYRGRNVIYHAIMNEEREFGGTLHYMDESFDTGDIIAVERFPIELADTAGDIIEKTYEALWKLFKEYVPDILKGRLPLAYGQTGGTYYKASPINDTIELFPYQEKILRAITVNKKFYPRVSVGGRTYKIIPENNNV